MTARQTVMRTQRLLGAGVIVTALAWGAALYFAALALGAFASFFAGTKGDGSVLYFAAPLILGIGVTALRLWRGRSIGSRGRVALWIEERLPRLHYALVSALEPGLVSNPRALEAVIAGEDISGTTRSAIRRMLVPAAGALIVAVALLYVSPVTAFGRSSVLGRLGGSRAGGELAMESRLGGLRVEVVPPAYSGQARQTLDDPESVRALVGSTVTISGAGPSRGIVALLGSASTPVSETGSRWRVRIVMPGKAAALTFTDRSFERIVVLEPQNDEAPKVALLFPAHDTTVRTPQLITRLHAETTDDVALTTGYFEYLITSGAGEIFSARTVTTPPVDFGRARTGKLDATLSLPSLKVSPGDVVSVRAVVRDANTLSGPSIGTSETRTFRVARAGEYDSISVDAAAPPPVDSSAISQRMLVIMTEALVKKQKTLSRAEWVKQATDIGFSEDRIRKRVYDILYETDSPEDAGDTEEAESEMHAIANPDLKEAYDALWDAVRSLQIAEAREALPPMRVALAALDRARLAKRLYLRGIPPRIIVDLQRVRLTGREKGDGSSRSPRSFADSARARLSARFYSALDAIASSPARAMRDLALLRVDALSVDAKFAAALSDATEAMRAGRDATLPLLRARRALDGVPEATSGLPLWSGGDD